MEESEKRRERLKAMRMEAAQVGVHSEDGYSGGASYSLTNPLVEASATPSVHAGPNVARRFDYYTDPMSAFSADKSWSKVSHQISPDFVTPPSNCIFFNFILSCVHVVRSTSSMFYLIRQIFNPSVVFMS